jgi:ComEC/Rec2-related protein
VISTSQQLSNSPLFIPALLAGSGLWLAYHFQVAWWIALCLTGLLLIGAVVFIRLRRGLLPLVCLLGFFTHGQLAYHHQPVDALRFNGDFHQRTVVLRLLVDEEPKVSESFPDRVRFPARILAIRRGEQWIESSGRIDCRLEMGEGAQPDYGDVIEGPVFLTRPTSLPNPATFDAPGYFWVRHLDYRGRIPAGEWIQVERGRGFLPVRWAIQFRQHMREKLRAGLEDRPQSSALLAAMLFGERDGLNDDQIRQFEVTGTLHLFAVSGQNIQLIALVMMVVLYALGLIRWRWGWLMITPLFIFVISTGMESSAVRAFLMASLVWISFVLYRPAQPLNILAGSALLIWVVDPRQLFDLGFQFSFLVVLGLVLFAPGVYRFIYRRLAPDEYLPRKYLSVLRRRFDQGWSVFCGLLATSFVAWCCSLPITLGEFHLFSPVAVLANLIVVPLASAVLILSLVSVMAGSFWTALSIPVNQLSAVFLQGVVMTTQGLSAWPGAYQYVSLHARPEAGAIRVTIPAGYQSMTAWVETAEQTMLIGPGHPRDWPHATFPCARYLGIDQIDSLLMSGANTATMGAAALLEGDVPIRQAVAGAWSSRSPAWKEWATTKFPAPTACSELDSNWREFAGPNDRVRVHGRTLENASLHVRIETGQTSIHYLSNPGHSSYQVLEAESVEADILIIEPGQQGARIPVRILRQMKPQLLVLPAPGYASFGSLTKEGWRFLIGSGTHVVQLEWDGAVMIEVNPEEAAYATFLPEGNFSAPKWKTIRQHKDRK